MGEVILAVQVGSVAQWLTIAAVLGFAYFMFRGQAGPAVGILSDANKVLTDELAKRDRAIKALEDRTQELEKKTDVSLALKPLIEWSSGHEASDERRHIEVVNAFAPIIASLENHDHRETVRHEAMLRVLQLMADRFPPEDEWDGHERRGGERATREE